MISSFAHQEEDIKDFKDEVVLYHTVCVFIFHRSKFLRKPIRSTVFKSLTLAQHDH